MLFTLLSQPAVVVSAFLLSLVAAVTVHEFAHAWVAYKLGDDTPYLQGRVTLNPAAHLDPWGSLVFLFLGMGWGRPVIYNPMRLSKRIDELYIALAGPASNLVFALVLNVIIHVIGNAAPTYALFLGQAADLNVILAAFNMIPIPPLDGSSIVAYFWPEYRSLIGGQIGLILLLTLIFVRFSADQSLISTIVEPIATGFASITHLFGIL